MALAARDSGTRGGAQTVGEPVLSSQARSAQGGVLTPSAAPALGRGASYLVFPQGYHAAPAWQ